MPYQIRPADRSLWPELGRGVALDRRPNYPAAVRQATKRAATEGEDCLITRDGAEVATVSPDGRVRPLAGGLVL